ncbi:MauE/DoxX family redox-associated membrane protein [Seonamhaeicola marinus]|uniref:Methylamine utilisation protein MauE domain-containing protein n=1 Tax=Seonamhaeicola marinus TaxID=1912246 RepID=A0A5D0J5J1_9FLAO|nr:MauE/DoxX family redox-associated membrane protein [Seonamhaeicola marinus]TYA89192.1 hypothetical protein FUA24_03380 [Seonamhaeicola marinus]
MRRSNKGYQITANSICFLFIILFVYAATSKLMDFNHFKSQLGRSPYISPYANWMVWAIPSVELLITGLFLFPKQRVLALYSSLSLMTIFTTYLIVVLNFSDSIPCSCGGILATLGWKEHIIFNGAFIVLALIGILSKKKTKHTT